AGGNVRAHGRAFAPQLLVQTSARSGRFRIDRAIGMFRRMNKLSMLGAAVALLACTSVQAMGPFEVYEQALRNDPVFLGAIKERDAGLENRAIGRAGLLPKLGYTYNKGR